MSSFSQKSVIGVLMETGKMREAEQERRREMVVLEKHAAIVGAPQVRIELGAAYINVAELLMRNDRPADSLEWTEKAIRIHTSEYEKNVKFIAAKQALAKTVTDAAPWRKTP
jgi:hypothetical protein